MPFLDSVDPAKIAIGDALWLTYREGLKFSEPRELHYLCHVDKLSVNNVELLFLDDMVTRLRLPRPMLGTMQLISGEYTSGYKHMFFVGPCRAASSEDVRAYLQSRQLDLTNEARAAEEQLAAYEQRADMFLKQNDLLPVE